MTTKFDAWVSPWVHAWLVLHEILNHHYCVRVMEMIWDIPLSLNRQPSLYLDIHHVQLFHKAKVPEPVDQLWPGMGTFALAPGEEERKDLPKREDRFTIKLPARYKNEKFLIKDWKKKKRKSVPNQRSEEKQKKKGNLRSKIGRRKKKRYTERSSDQAIFEQYRIDTNKWEKKGKHDIKWPSTYDCQPKILCAGDFLAPR